MKMGLRMAAVMAGLIMAFASSTANAAMMNATYNVDLTFGSGLDLTGTVVTNGTIGSLTAADILSYDLFFDNIETTNNNSKLMINGTSLIASRDDLEFSPQENFDYVRVVGGPISLSVFAVSAVPETTQIRVAEYGIQFGSILVVNAPATIGSVPLPTSAPMFGAALFGLACLGWATKGKSAAAA